ncbi:hypothetical protein PoB_001767500 [Plakobranchus ocellatus]|uniref:Uncharacterized protein n=1 Tax=Plakobranchus ocellatus TaxID=259542 RepID=A0AAV3Z7R4_9GAST|nr:hypothetical protein PoB_001767500 [Plakobranchus ocellatus]
MSSPDGTCVRTSHVSVAELECKPQDNQIEPSPLASPPANVEELPKGNQDCILHSPETLIPTSIDSQAGDLDCIPTDASSVASPEISQIVRGRKRRQNESSWNEMKRKKILNLGEEYTSKKGKVVGRKIMKAAVEQPAECNAMVGSIENREKQCSICFGRQGALTKEDCTFATMLLSRIRQLAMRRP